MVGGAVRHLHSLRLMRRDGGWIHTLLQEAENERMHLLTFIELRKPGPLFRAAVLLAQGIVFNVFFASYLISPKTCHRFVGYLEEEAVRTYTHALADLDAGLIPEWTSLAAPEIAVSYWKLKSDATMKDLLLAVRADEANHSHVNHAFASLSENAVNPFSKGHPHLPQPDFTQPPPGIDLQTGLPSAA
jgi:threonyl-tRNA synthetase